MYRLGLLSFSDGRERVHADLAPAIDQHAENICNLLEGCGEIEIIRVRNIVCNPELARSESLQLNQKGLDGVLFNIPVFAFPNYIVIAAQMTQLPLLLISPQDNRYPGLTGLLAASGSLKQIGRIHECLWTDLETPRFIQGCMEFARVAAAVTRLKGQVYGLVGGRSIGMYTGDAPAERWQTQFGIDVDHVDQLEIIRRAELVDDREVLRARSWINEKAGAVIFDEPHFSNEKFDFETRCCIALKTIIADRHLDFVGLKCHYDLSEYYCVQCFSAAFVNDPYDWDGPKQPVPLACEADSDGALTMQILKLISGKPTCLLDLRSYDPKHKVYVMPNCGSAPTWFAARSQDPDENLAKVRIVPSIKKYSGGGGHVEFVFAAGPLTLARLGRTPTGYHLVIAYGDAVELPISDVQGANPGWPHAFIRLNVEPDMIVEQLPANHLHAVAGDYRKELIKLCNLLQIQPILITP